MYDAALVRTIVLRAIVLWDNKHRAAGIARIDATASLDGSRAVRFCIASRGLFRESHLA